LIVWGSGLAFTLAIFAAFTVIWLASTEDICLDRSPWWGPPENPEVYSSCSGHINERLEAGYGPFSGPK
jgi:hypothetical protein